MLHRPGDVESVDMIVQPPACGDANHSADRAWVAARCNYSYTTIRQRMRVNGVAGAMNGMSPMAMATPYTFDRCHRPSVNAGCLTFAMEYAAVTGSHRPHDAARPLPEPPGTWAKGRCRAAAQSGRLSRPCE